MSSPVDICFKDAAGSSVAASEAAPFPIQIIDADATINLTGDVVVDTLGDLDDSKEVDPDAASATLPALARGQLKQLVDILAKLSADPSTQTTLATLALESGGNLDDIADALDAIATGIGAAGDAADAGTVIGQLKQIVINTTPAP